MKDKWEYRTAITEGNIDTVRWTHAGEPQDINTAFVEWAGDGWELVVANALPSGNVQYIFRKQHE